MAAPAPLLPIVIPPAAANNPAFDDDPIYFPGGHPLVTATSSFMSWQPVAAAPGAQAQQVSAPFHAVLYAFGIRFKVSPLPADVAAARAINIFTLRFTAAYWTRALSEYLCASGLAPPGTIYNNVAELHSVISGLVIQNPILLNIAANDWNASAAFASPGAAPAQAAARARFAEVAFLSIAPIRILPLSKSPSARAPRTPLGPRSRCSPRRPRAGRSEPLPIRGFGGIYTCGGRDSGQQHCSGGRARLLSAPSVS